MGCAQISAIGWGNGGDHVSQTWAQALRLVRTFRGHSGRITDLVVSEDRRWLVSAAEDGTVRVWDVPAARVLQV
jgi:WD40 repeat protein